MKVKSIPVLCCLLSSFLAMPQSSPGQAQLLIRDSPADTGAEPDVTADPIVNPNLEMWVSRDIWNTTKPMSGYTPYVYSSAAPPAWLPATDPNQNPQYRNPRLSQPNYIYVRISNMGTVASTGTEQLHVYWSKGSTGLSWPNQWVDYLDTFCGPSALYGIEITKPRRNIADPTVPLSEVQNYLSAINAIAASPYLFSDGVPYWFKQQAVHYFIAQGFTQHYPLLTSGAGAGTPEFAAHGTDGFWPWHREFLSRYETLLREANPTVTLFYWDWTTDPRTIFPAVVSSASPTGIGSYSGEIASAFSSASMINLAAQPFVNDAATGSNPYGANPPATTVSPAVTRFIGTFLADKVPTGVQDSQTTSQTSYTAAREWDEGEASTENGAHDYSHEFIGGAGSVFGNMGDLTRSAEDPFFFLLHANADRLWARWQRTGTSTITGSQAGSNMDPSHQLNVNPLAYAGTMNIMTDPMAPWNGFTYNASAKSSANPQIVVSPLTPWTQTTGDETTFKTASDDSVVFPPIYDNAPLTVPVLQPGQSVVIEIPWYPPDPANFTCGFFTDPGHVCLLARITTSDTYPYGMDNPETSSVYYNAQYNSKIGWRNETVLDGGTSPPGPLITEPILVRNLFSQTDPVQLNLSLNSISNKTLADFGTVVLDLGPVLFNLWSNNGRVAQGFVTNGGAKLLLIGTNGFVGNIPMTSNEVEQVQVELTLSNGYASPQGQAYSAGLIQYGGGVTGASNELVGGQLFTFNFNQLDLVPKGSPWRYINQYPGSNWTQVGFNDSQWASGNAKLGYGIGDEATVLNSSTSNLAPYITMWFRNDFIVNDPAFFTNLWLQLEAYDGAVVYLNGAEIARRGMPAGGITPGTLASGIVTGLATETFYPTDVSDFLPLLSDTNVLAVEVHLASTNVVSALGLDLELVGNVFSPTFPPQVAFLPLTNGTLSSLYLLGQPIQLGSTAIGPVNAVNSVSYYSDGQFIGTATVPPYAIAWSNAPPGIHQMTAQALDSVGVTGRGFATLDVVSNLPPVVYMTNPVVGQLFSGNAVISMGAIAQESGGGIQRVDFYYTKHGAGFFPNILAATALTPPYVAQISNLPPACYWLTAVATDNLGIRSDAVPIPIEVLPNPTLAINYSAPFVTITWTPTNAVLQQARLLTGPWQSLTNVTTPYGFVPNPTNRSMFYRVSMGTNVICGP